MTDQPNNGGGAAPQGTVPAPSLPGGSDISALIAQYEAQIKVAREEAGTWEKRYKGQQTALQDKSTLAQQRETELATLRAEYEGFKGTADAQTADWTKRVADLQKLADEREVKLKDYDLRDSTRSLIAKDFAALLPDFDNDPVVQAGVLALAKTAEPEALKNALAASLASKTNGQQAAIAATLRGGSPPAPAGGVPATVGIEELQKQIAKAKAGSPEKAALMEQFAQLLKTTNIR